MATKVCLTIPKNLSERDQNDLRSLLKDAFFEFMKTRCTPRLYVEKRYPNLSPADANIKAQQVERRLQLSSALFDAAFQLDIKVDPTNHSACTEPCGPNCMNRSMPALPLPIYDYYRACTGDDLAAASAALELLAASKFPGGARGGWVVDRVEGQLDLHGPAGERARWNNTQWGWIQGGAP